MGALIAFCLVLALPPLLWLVVLAVTRRWRWVVLVTVGFAALFVLAGAVAAWSSPDPAREGPQTRGEVFLVSLLPGLGLACLLGVAFTPQLSGLRRPGVANHPVEPNDASHH